MNWIGQHVGAIGGGGGIAALLGLLFKDFLREWWQDYHAERTARRAARAAHDGSGHRAMAEVISLLREDISRSWTRSEKIEDLLTRMVVANERSLDVQRIMSNQLSDFDKRLGHIEGAHRIS